MPHIAFTRRSLLAAGLSLVAQRRLVAATAPTALTDLMPRFWRVYDRDASAPLPARVNRLRSDFIASQQTIYDRAGMVRITAEELTTWLPRFDAMADEVRSLHRGFAAAFDTHMHGFTRAFPDFDAASAPVFVLPSLFRFDAHLESHESSLPLFFGLDGVVRYHGNHADLGVLFAHEFFHCYQAQKNPSLSLDPQAPVYGALWLEGVATYVSERLNPDASLLHVLLDDDELLRRGPAYRRKMALALLDRIDSRRDADLAAFFASGYRGEWPARAGYYVGLLAARNIGRSLDMVQMAALSTPQVREQLVEQLKQLAR